MRYVFLLFIVLVLFPSCAALGFGRHLPESSKDFSWYGIDPSTGKILGKTPADDLPLSVCQGDDKIKGKCVVFVNTEAFRLFSAYDACRIRLSQYEKDHP